jgi:hypothetical protein
MATFSFSIRSLTTSTRRSLTCRPSRSVDYFRSWLVNDYLADAELPEDDVPLPSDLLDPRILGEDRLQVVHLDDPLSRSMIR